MSRASEKEKIGGPGLFSHIFFSCCNFLELLTAPFVPVGREGIYLSSFKLHPFVYVLPASSIVKVSIIKPMCI